MAGDQGGAAVDLGEAVRIFQKLVPPHEFDASRGVTPSMVYTPWIVAWLMVYQRLNQAAPLSDAVAELAGMDDDLVPRNKRTRERALSANTGAYAGARSRLGVEAAEAAADRVSDALMAHAGAGPLPGGRRAFLVDGSTLALTPAEALRQAYPPPKNQHGLGHRPALRLVTAHDLASGASIRPEIGPIHGAKAVGEVALAGPLLGRLPEGSIVVGDRNFGIFLMAWMATGAGHDFLFRLTQVRFRALARRARVVGPGTWQLTWRPSRWDLKHNPGLAGDAAVSVRLHEVRISDRLTLWLVSSLEATGPDLAAIYHGRQDVETDIRDLKQTLSLDVLRSRSEEMIRKELAAATIAYDLVILVRKLAAAAARIEPRRLSFARVHSLVKVLLRSGHPAPEPAEVRARVDQVLRMAAQCKLPNRPGRSYPREAFAKPTKYSRRKIVREVKQ
jgi:hypothetical protein